jgi:hypothetical protein
METTKFYSSKSNAKRAAAKAGIDLATAVLVEGEGGFAYTAPAAPEAPVAPAAPEADLEVSEHDKGLIAMCGHSHCPHCEIHLSNGVMDFDSLVETAGSFKAAFESQQHEWSCMGCGGEWGAEITEAPAQAPAAAPTGTGVKIEKNREERNGVKRPSVGGMCRAVWDFCDAHQAANGAAPAVKDVKAAAETNSWNANNASIEYYLWRKFMGIRGRQAK